MKTFFFFFFTEKVANLSISICLVCFSRPKYSLLGQVGNTDIYKPMEDYDQVFYKNNIFFTWRFIYKATEVQSVSTSWPHLTLQWQQMQMNKFFSTSLNICYNFIINKSNNDLAWQIWSALYLINI